MPTAPTVTVTLAGNTFVVVLGYLVRLYCNPVFALFNHGYFYLHCSRFSQKTSAPKFKVSQAVHTHESRLFG